MRHIKTQFKKISKSFIIFLLGLQLALSPCLSYAQYPNGSKANGSNGSKAVSTAKKFNKDVLALRRVIFGDGRKRTTYASHPLDVFGLLNQKVGFPIEETPPIEEISPVETEPQKELTAEQTTKQIAEQTAKQLEQIDAEKKELTPELIEEQAEEDKPTYRQRTKEYWKKKTNKWYSYVKGPQIAPPRPPELLFEVYNQAGDLVSVFSHESKKAELPFRRPDLKDKITNSEGFISPAWEKNQNYSLKISYQGKPLHSFPQNIIWASTIGGYLLFLEPSMVSDKKAVISFINLEYFTTALGKAALPIFRIPVSFEDRTLSDIEKLTDFPLPLLSTEEKEIKNLEKNKVVLSPEFILNEGSYLNIGGFELPLDYIHFLSRLQQFHFNFSVSLVDPSGFVQTTESIKDILRTYTEALTKDFAQKNKTTTLEQQGQYADLMQILEKSIGVRNSIGSQSRPSGGFGKIANAQATLAMEEDKENKKLYEAFSEHLKQDIAYQKAIQDVGDKRSKELKKFARMKTFLAHITRPRPLGAAKIQQALGLVAGTVLPGESIKGRWSAFKEGTAQLLSYGSIPVKSAALIGLGSLAHPDVANFFYQGLVLSGEWMSRAGTIVGTTVGTAFHGFNLTNLPAAYFLDGKYVYLAKGLTALLLSFIAFAGIIHFSSNLYDFAKNLKSQKVQNHNQLAHGLLSRWRESLKKFFNKDNFVSYVDKGQKSFIDDLRRAEWRSLGFFAHIKESGKKSWTEAILQVPETEWKHFFSIFQSKEKPIEWEMQITPEGSEIPLVLSLKSVEEKSKVGNLPTLSLKFSDEDKEVTRQFEIISGNKDAFLEQGEIKKGVTVSLSGEDLFLQGQMLNTKYTKEEEERVRQAVYEALKTTRQKQNGINLLDNIESEKELVDQIIKQSLPSSKEINAMPSALLHLASGYSSWTKTFKSMGLIWNWFFLSRNFVFRPTAGLSWVWFAHYFDRIYEKKHIATRFNGAYNSRLGEGARWLKASLSNNKQTDSITYAELLRGRKTFEETIIPIEKQFMVESINTAYFNMVEQAVLSPNPHIDAALRKARANPDRPRKDITDVFYKELRGKERMVFEIHWRSLFQLGVKDFLIERAGLAKNLSNSEVKKQFISKLQTGEVDFSIEDKKKTKERLWRVNKEFKLAQKARKVVHSMFSGFLKKRQVKYAMKSEKTLSSDRKNSIVMNRFDVAKRMLNDPEALARTSRFMLAKLMVDKPIELLWLFVILAGVDTGVMMVLHDKAFTEDALFHLGRYSVWHLFFGYSILSLLTEVWMKVQTDSLAPDGKAKVYPTKTDTKKRFGYVRWYFEQFLHKKHTLWEAYKAGIFIMYANLGAAVITYAFLYAFALGRFDIGLFLGGLFLYIVTPLVGIYYKTEWTFERSVHFSLKNLIKNGLDLDKKDAHLLTHPLVQALKIKSSNKLRKQYNLTKVIFYENFSGFLAELLQAGDVKGMGSRAFQRMFFGYSLPTEHLVNFLDWMEEKGLSSNIVNTCKKAFTNNRSDLDL